MDNILLFSQARQDEAVIRLTGAMMDGSFVDIGAGHPRFGSNTYTLETDFEWRGILCDKTTESELREERNGLAVFGDAFEVDWHKECKSIAEDSRIDYLSLDIEPPELTMAVLLRLPLDHVRFKIITIEHDAYRTGRGIRAAMRGVLSEHGYARIASDVCVECNGKLMPFEDWWVDPQVVDVAMAQSVIDEMKIPLGANA
jgi:uncharacterized Fe-S cluster protein YjdI